MNRRVSWLSIALLSVAPLAGGCDPYEGWSGDFSAGPVDPINFPPEYLGTGGDRFRQGGGIFKAKAALVGGAPADYFSFSMGSAQSAVKAPFDPLVVFIDGQPTSAVPSPIAYVFDPTDTSPIPATPACDVEGGYSYDSQRDEVPLDRAGNIFTALPSSPYTAGQAATTSYVPVVRQVPVGSNGVPCQGPKDAEQLLERDDVSVEKVDLPGGKKQGVPDGKLLAWAIIDPGAAVYRSNEGPSSTPTPETAGLGLQQWGWYQHYLLAYLDGGYIPTQDGTVTRADGSTVPVTRMVTQKLYVPRSNIITPPATPTGTPTTAPGKTGAGYDVLQFTRGQPGYSPVCEVVTYDFGADTAADALPKSAADIEATYAATFQPGSPRYLYCLQLP